MQDDLVHLSQHGQIFAAFGLEVAQLILLRATDKGQLADFATLVKFGRSVNDGGLVKHSFGFRFH